MESQWQSILEQVREASLGLDYELSRHPIQANGVVGRRAFYFLAKHSNWTFEMSDDLGALPSDTGNNSVFTLSARHKFADEMSPDEVKSIIRECVLLYLKIAEKHL